MNEFCTWVTEKLERKELTQSGGFTMNRLATEEPRQTDPIATSFSYIRMSIVGKPSPYNMDTNTFPIMKVDAQAVTVPIESIAADLQISADIVEGSSVFYEEAWESAYTLAMNAFLMNVQDAVENGVATMDGKRLGMWDNDQIIAQKSPMVLDPSKPLVTPEDGAKFLNFLGDMARSVGVASKHMYKADTMVIPSELEGFFDRPIPQYGNMAGTNARNWLKENHGITLETSYNAKSYNGGQILVYQRDQARYFMVSDVKISTDSLVVARSGANLYFPIKSKFSGFDFKQPLSAMYFNNVLKADSVQRVQASRTRKTSTDTQATQETQVEPEGVSSDATV